MGLFSFVGKAAKALGKIAAPLVRAAANKLTGGLSETVLKKLKGNPAKLSAMQTQALIEKTGGYTPKVQRTESRVEGWGFGKVHPPKTQRAMKRKPRQPSMGPRKPTRARTAARRPVAKAPKVKSTRKPPTGGLDLRALSVSWKAAGKPGKWIDWVKANK